MSERGSATILTLLVSAVIITVAIGFNWLVKEHLKAAEGLKAKAEAMMAARSTYDGLIFHVLSGRMTAKEIVFSTTPNPLGTARLPLGRDGIKLTNGVTVSVQDSSSLISLHSPNVETIKRLAAVVGADRESLNSLADSFLDWIDPDDLSRLNGAERVYYKSHGKDYAPRNFPLQYKDEFALVRGIGPELYSRMAPYLTLLPASGFNPNTADDRTLMAYLDIDAQALEKLKSYRAQTAISTDSEILALTGKFIQRDTDGVYYFPSPFFEITVSVGTPKVIYRVHAGIDIRPKPLFPYGIIYWTEG